VVCENCLAGFSAVSSLDSFWLAGGGCRLHIIRQYCDIFSVAFFPPSMAVVVEYRQTIRDRFCRNKKWHHSVLRATRIVENRPGQAISTAEFGRVLLRSGRSGEPTHWRTECCEKSTRRAASTKKLRSVLTFICRKKLPPKYSARCIIRFLFEAKSSL
jgi:hypothetical protein